MTVTYPTSILQLTDDEQHQLAKIALLRLQALDLPCVVVAPKRVFLRAYLDNGRTYA